MGILKKCNIIFLVGAGFNFLVCISDNHKYFSVK